MIQVIQKEIYLFEHVFGVRSWNRVTGKFHDNENVIIWKLTV